MRLNEGERAPGRRRILLKGEHGRDAQPSSITGKDAAIPGWRDFNRCNSPAVNKNGWEKVDAGMYSLIPLARTAGKLQSQ
jgi:hypothetical protein